MKATWGMLTGLVLLATTLPCFAQTPVPAEPATTAASRLLESLMFYEAGDFKGSLLAAREALRLANQTSAIAYNNICTAHIRLEQYEQAIEACRNSLERFPLYEHPRNNLGWIYEIQAEQNPTVGVYLNLGEIRHLQGALDESIAASKKALALDPNSAIAYNNLCAAHAASGNWALAVTECKKALAIKPGYELATANLAWAQSGQADSR